jgi:hypothetical protein
MKLTVEMRLVLITHVPSFIYICSGVQKLMRRKHRHTQAEMCSHKITSRKSIKNSLKRKVFKYKPNLNESIT